MAIRFNRRKFLVYGSATLGTSFFLKACTSTSPTTTTQESPTAAASPATNTSTTAGGDIACGNFTPLSGTMAISEKSVVDAEQLAIEKLIMVAGARQKNSSHC